MSARRAFPWIALLALGAASADARAATDGCRADSGARTLPLVELYTSEGCSSCPPADRWLAQAFGPGATTPAAVLAFHVDYWDRLGWPDRFARAAWSSRQHSIAQAARSNVVYTPQVMMQGRGVDGWRSGATMRDIASLAATPPRATIAVDARVVGRRVAIDAKAQVAAAADRPGARLVVAHTDGGHRTEVRRGENAGVTLAHEHVVRVLVQGEPADASGALALQTTFDLPADAGREPRVIAFVERHAQREVLQALALPLDRCGVAPPR